MKIVNLTSAAVFACALIAALPAQAALVEFTFGGVITSTTTSAGPLWSPPPEFGSIQVGQTWSMRYVFDSTRPGSPNQPRVFFGAIRSIELTINGVLLTSTTNRIGDITLTESPFGDQYDTSVQIPTVSNVGRVAMGVVLIDPTGNAFSSIATLPTSLTLDAFANRFFFLGPLNAQNQYRGSVTYFIPAPGAGVAIAGLGALALRRRRAR